VKNHYFQFPRNLKIPRELEVMILKAIEDSQTLTARHRVIADAIAGDKITNFGSWSGSLWELSSIEVRPSKMVDMIRYFEAYIMCYPIYANNKFDGNEHEYFNPIFKVFQNSSILERNAQKQNALVNQKIEQLSYLVLLLHKIVFYTDKYKDTISDTVDYKNPNYEMQIESLKDLTINYNEGLHNDDDAYREIYDTQTDCLKELKILQGVYSYYIEAEKAINLYNLSLVTSYKDDRPMYDKIFRIE